MKIKVTEAMIAAGFVARGQSADSAMDQVRDIICAALDAIAWPIGEATMAEAQRAWYTYREFPDGSVPSVQAALTEAFAARGLPTTAPAASKPGIWYVQGGGAYHDEAQAMAYADAACRTFGKPVIVSRGVAEFSPQPGTVRKDL